MKIEILQEIAGQTIIALLDVTKFGVRSLPRVVQVTLGNDERVELTLSRFEECKRKAIVKHEQRRGYCTMTAEPATNAIESLILEALKQGDKNRGQLFDFTGKNYSVLVQALQRLKQKELIESYFIPSGQVSVLTYRLRSRD